MTARSDASAGKTQLAAAPWVERGAKACPIEMRTRIGLASRRDMFMAGNPAQGVRRRQRSGQLGQSAILHVFEWRVVAAFEFDADGKIVAALTPFMCRQPGMPGALEGRYELRQTAVARNQEMRGDAQTLQFGKTGVGRGIEPVTEQLIYIRRAESDRKSVV